MNLLHLFALAGLAYAPLAVLARPLEIATPRCEGLRNPLGIVRTQPRFSWALAGDEPAARPTAAEVKVFTDAGMVWQGRGDDLFARVYNGPPLASGVVYQWQARLVGATDWCEPQRFTIGLQTDADWAGAQWIGEPAVPVAWTDFNYQATFTLVRDAFGLLFRARDAQTGYLWQINTKLDREPLLRPHLLLGDGKLRLLPPVKLGRFFPKGLDWTKEHVLRIETRGTTIRTFLDGVPIHTCTDATFAAGTVGVRTSAGEEAFVSEVAVTGPDGASWLHDRFRGHLMPAFRNPPLANDRLHLAGATLLHPGILPKNTPRLRRTFTLRNKPVVSALASACGFGFYELWLNGEKADPRRVLAPGMTGGRAALFDTYDVTRLLKPGAANTVGFWLAAGYSDDFSRYGWHWLKPRRAILHLAVTYADGSRDVVVTDGSWEMTQTSEVTRASLYHGETIDAAHADPAWCTPAGATNGWHAVHVWPHADAPRLVANDAPPVRMLDPRKPVRIAETRPGVFVADFGQNRAGFVQVRAQGPKGTKIRLHTSELLGEDGNIDPWTNRRAESTDEFILAGTGKPETFTPRFTYHGFQFVEITGWPGKPTADDLTAWAVHADVEPIGSFTCDDDTLNRYVNAANWSMRSNFMSFPTDCCMRDERTPCQMDSQAYEDAALNWFELGRYYTKWLDDIGVGGGNPDWTGDSVVLPWRLYQATGDARILAERYDGMKRQVDGDVEKWPNLVCPTGFGDWCAPNDGTWKGYFNDVELVNTALFCEMCRIVAEAAAVLGRTEDAAAYRALHVHAKAAFQTAFFHPETKTYGDGSQTTAVLPLAFGLVPEAERAAVAARLVRTIREEDKGRVNVGIFGMRHLGDVLCDLGESDLFVRLMTQPDYPGFGSMFARGATSLWEQWSFKGGMNSHTHAMFSGALHALMTRLAGIRAAGPGFAAIEIRPSFPQSLAHVKAHRDTPRGRIEVEWTRKGTALELDILVPPYTEARLSLPGQPPRRLPAGMNHMTWEGRAPSRP